MFFIGTILVMAGLSVGCRLVFWTGAVAVGTVGLVGYTVYKGGESVATGVGNVVGGSSKDKEAETVVYSGKVFKAEYDGSVEQVWMAATQAFRRANFQNLTGNYDLLSGQLTAQTWDKTPVALNLTSADKNRTTLGIMVGPDGDLNASQSIYHLIQEELKKTATAHPAGDQKKNVAP